MWLLNILLCISLLGGISGYLLFTRNTVAQFSTGLTVPLVLPKRSIAFSLVAQANYNMPYNTSNFQPLVISARNKPFDISRKTFYKYIVQFLESYGLEGEECLLRSICEISEIPMHITKGESLLEKIVHFIFTPSLEFNQKNVTRRKSQSFVDKLLQAEEIGLENGNCAETYSDCIVSIVDLFTAKYII